LNEKYGADIYLLNTPNVDISSSDIRRMIKEGKSIKDLVPEAVFQFIEEKQLFRDE
jgi:nicotinate-nucleotide adenylyltransferase